MKSNSIRNSRQNESGFSLVELLIAVGILGIVSAGVASSSVFMHTELKRYKAIATREALRSEIRQSLLGASSFQRSDVEPANAFLKNCVDASQATVCDGSQHHNFVMLAGNGQQLAGPNASFNIDGASCAPYSSSCPFKISMRIKPTCAGGAASCGEAASLDVRYDIEVHPDFDIRLKSVVDADSTVDTGAFRTGNLAMVCPAGSYMTGIGSNGGVLCQTGTNVVNNTYSTDYTTNGGGGGEAGGDAGGAGGGSDGGGGGSEGGGCSGGSL